jgi:23S rRNA pseudouridine2605 synthase
MRLAKYLAHAGVASRRAAEEIVRAGRVSVAGEVVTDPARDVDDTSDVEVDGIPLDGAESRVVYALNKPRGIVSTAKDTHGRTTVVDLVKGKGGARLYPVGRLDADSTGLLLLTNDGDLANRLTHPSREVPKTYRVKVRSQGPVPPRALRALRDGVELDDGPTAPARVRQVEPGTLEITIHEGRNHQVKRMCEAVGHPVQTLQRVRFGSLELGDMKLGAIRRLTEKEIAALRTDGERGERSSRPAKGDRGKRSGGAAEGDRGKRSGGAANGDRGKRSGGAAEGDRGKRSSRPAEGDRGKRSGGAAKSDRADRPWRSDPGARAKRGDRPGRER